MKTSLPSILTLSISMLFISKKNEAQSLNMGSIVNFVAFTGNGSISNIGTSTISGHVGTSLGNITGFDSPSTMNGNKYSANSITDSGKVDLLNIYIHLQNIPVTNTTHTAAFGSGETILPGIYSIGGVGSLAGALVLNGQGNSDAVFIMRFEGGFSAAASSSVTLTNGARSANVFWIAEGVISVGTTVAMMGTMIAHPGGISFGEGSSIDGRMFSTDGAISFNAGNAKVPNTLSTVPVDCASICDNPIMGSIANFAMFSSNGTVSNVASSGFIGNAGSNAGTVTGFESSIMVGSVQIANSITNQAKIDLQAAYDSLKNIASTNTTHATIFGNGETLTPGIYSIANAGSIGGTLTLNGQGNTDARFVFRFNGAFSAGAQSKVILINGARRCNIFWVAEGAISMGTFSFMKGNFIANNAEIGMAANGNLEGRMLSTHGTVSFSTGVAYIAYTLCGGTSAPALPITLLSFKGNCENQQVTLKWSTATEQNSKHFEVERSIDGNQWEIINRITAAGNSTTQQTYSFIDKAALIGLNYYYRLNSIDLNGSNKYSNIINVKNCGNNVKEDILIYPNISSGQFNVYYEGDKREVYSHKIFNDNGLLVYSSNGYQSNFDLSTKASGMYFVKTQLKTKIVTHKIMIVK